MTALVEWQAFAEVVGSAAGALTGLQFVVMALISEMPMRSGEHETGEAFATPTIVHFTAVLMMAASLAVPWQSLRPVCAVWALGGIAGLLYSMLVLARMRKQVAYKPVLEDWVFHTVLPCCAYTVLAGSGISVVSHTGGALLSFAAAGLLLLFIGIHNAWDNVLYLVMLKRQRLDEAAVHDRQAI